MNESEFEAWYRREHRKVIASLVAVTDDADAAREATDEAFARALARADHLDKAENATGWVYRVALNYFRRGRRRRSLERRLLSGSYEPESHVPEPDRDLWDAVRRLPKRQCEAIALRYVADLPETEIATAMGISRGAVSSSLATARKALSELLREAHAPSVNGGTS